MPPGKYGKPGRLCGRDGGQGRRTYESEWEVPIFLHARQSPPDRIVIGGGIAPSLHEIAKTASPSGSVSSRKGGQFPRVICDGNVVVGSEDGRLIWSDWNDWLEDGPIRIGARPII